MKKITGIILGVIGILLVAALLVPSFITLNRYKPEIQQKALEATGRDIVINGDIRLGILPSPFARLTDVVITNPQGASSEHFASVKSIDVGVALAPLFSKKIQVTHIDVVEPVINLEVLADGSNNWQFKPQDETPSIAEPEPATAKEATNLSIDEFEIEKGILRYIDGPAQSTQEIGPINGKFNVASLQGPVSGEGSFTVMDKLPIGFNFKVDSLPSETNKTIPLRLILGVMNDAATADFKGMLQTEKNAASTIESNIAISDMAKILGAISTDGKPPELPAYLRGKVALNGMLHHQGDQAKIENLVIRAGSAEISGSMNAALKDTKTITIDLKNVVLPPESSTSSTASAKTTASKTQNLAQMLESNFSLLSGFLDTSLPGTPVNLVVTAAHLPLPGKALRDLRLAASSSETGITIQNFQAKMAGNTSLQVKADLLARKDGKIDHATVIAMVSTQNMQAAMGNPSQASEAPITINTTLKLTRQELRLKPLQVSQSGQTVNGSVIYTPGAAEALDIALKGSALNLDALLGKPSQSTATSGKETAAKVTAKNEPANPLAQLEGLRAKISADIDSVTYQHKTAKNIAVKASVSSAGLDLNEAKIGDLGGMNIAAKGKIASLSPLGGVDLNATANSPNLSRTLKTLGNEAAANLGASEFTATLKGDTNALDIALDGSIDQGTVKVKGTAKNLDKSPGFIGRIDITHPETATIVRNFGGLKPAVNLGAFALNMDAAYGADTLKADNLVVKLGSAGTLQGHINVTPEKDSRKIDAVLRADKLALAALMGDDTQTNAASVDTSKPSTSQQSWSKENIDLSALRNLNGSASVQIGELLYQKFVIHDFNTKVNFANNQIGLEQLKGNLFNNGPFNINGTLAPGAKNQAHRGDFMISITNADAAKLFVALGSEPFKKGTLDVNQKINFNGASPHALISSLNGDGQIKITNGVVNGIDLDGLAAKLDRPNSLSDFAAIIDQARAGGITAISDTTIPVLIRNGIVQVQNTVVKTAKTQMAMSGVVNFPPKTVDLTGQITFVEQRNLPPLTLLVKGPMNDPQKSFDTRSFTSFYAQKATEKLRENVTGKINDLLGIPSQPAPAQAPAEAAPTAPAIPENAIDAPSAPVAPTVPTAPERSQREQRDDALKQLGGQMLNNLLGGGGR